MSKNNKLQDFKLRRFEYFDTRASFLLVNDVEIDNADFVTRVIFI